MLTQPEPVCDQHEADDGVDHDAVVERAVVDREGHVGEVLADHHAHERGDQPGGDGLLEQDQELSDNTKFDYLLMDCGPSLGVLTLNALACAHEVFIPLQPHYLALHGLGKLLETTSLVAKRNNPALTRVSSQAMASTNAKTWMARKLKSAKLPIGVATM